MAGLLNKAAAGIASLYQSQSAANAAQLQQQQLLQQTVTTTSATAPIVWVTIPNGTTTTSTTTLGNNLMNSLYASQGQGTLAAGTSALVRDTLRLLGDVTIADGEPCKITMPDGTVIDVAQDGSFTINDTDAKVTYRANRVRDFNSYVNASDKLESFIKFCGEQGVRQGEMLDLPIKLFIGWLILQAAMADGENPDPVNLLEDLREHAKPRCIGCGRFIPRRIAERKIAFCRPVCLERELAA